MDLLCIVMLSFLSTDEKVGIPKTWVRIMRGHAVYASYVYAVIASYGGELLVPIYGVEYALRVMLCLHNKHIHRV